MNANLQIELPDIGDFTDVEIVEIHVAVGDALTVEDPIITLESDKATMDVPSPQAGVVGKLLVNIGDKISKGQPLIEIEPSIEPTSVEIESRSTAPTSEPETAGGETIIKLPSIGDFSDVEIIELHVALGDSVNAEDSILTLESDKASMDVPSPNSGTVTKILVAVGDRVSEGDDLVHLGPRLSQQTDEVVERSKEPEVPVVAPDEDERPYRPEPQTTRRPPPTPLPPPAEVSKSSKSHASPAIRRFARELGADLSRIRGSGPKGRILKGDVEQHVKQQLKEGYSGKFLPSTGIPPIPEEDFSKFGEIQKVGLSKIKRITGTRLHQSWLNIPHVTHHDEVDITELEEFRKATTRELQKDGVRITVLSFICKAMVATLQKFPTFNASLSPDSETLILKKYFNIGIAVDTPNGLVVPVLRNIAGLGVTEIAGRLQETGVRVRSGKSTPSDFEGGSITISSLGGIGGRFFTPIINPPEVAILGVSRHHTVTIATESGFETRLFLPLSLSYDHRVIDGAEAARFCAHLGWLLTDPRRILL